MSPVRTSPRRVRFETEKTFITSTPALAALTGDITRVSFVPEGFVGIGVHVCTDAFVQKFVVKACRTIIDDVEKLDSI